MSNSDRLLLKLKGGNNRYSFQQMEANLPSGILGEGEGEGAVEDLAGSCSVLPKTRETHTSKMVLGIDLPLNSTNPNRERVLFSA